MDTSSSGNRDVRLAEHEQSIELKTFESPPPRDTEAEKDNSDVSLHGADQDNEKDNGDVSQDQADQDIEQGSPQQQHAALSTEIYSVFTVPQKRAIILTGSFVSWFSPMSGSIYFPALNQIANELGVSSSKVNITVTTYLVSWQQRLPSGSWEMLTR